MVPSIVLRSVFMSCGVGLFVVQCFQSIETSSPPIWNQTRIVGHQNYRLSVEMRIFRGYVPDSLLSTIMLTEPLQSFISLNAN